MDEFGTGLRAHLGLDAAQLELAAKPAAPDAPPLAELVETEVGEPGEPEEPQLDALAALEDELNERERLLALREDALSSRAAALLDAARSLYEEVMVGVRIQTEDELARLRRRKSVA